MPSLNALCSRLRFFFKENLCGSCDVVVGSWCVEDKTAAMDCAVETLEIEHLKNSQQISVAILNGFRERV